MEEPRWLKENVVAAIHQRQLAEHGGLDGVRDPGMLSSALARPRNTFAYTQPKPDLATLAADYAFGVIKNHPFIDGNKRTCFMAAYTFLGKHQWELVASEPDAALETLRLAANDCSETEYAAWLKRNCRKVAR